MSRHALGITSRQGASSCSAKWWLTQLALAVCRSLFHVAMHCREQAGVKVRLELGPKEAAAGQCILAICTTPGEVAAKTTLQACAVRAVAVQLCWSAASAHAASLSVQAGPRLLKAVQAALGIDSKTQGPSKASLTAGHGSKPSAKGSSAAGKDSLQAQLKSVVAAAPPPKAESARSKLQPSAVTATAVPQKQFAASGDDYLDDFEELVEQTEAEKPAKTKPQKSTKRPKVVRL